MAIMQNSRRIRSALVVHTLLVLQELMCGLNRLTCRRQLVNGCVRYIVHVLEKLQQNEITASIVAVSRHCESRPIRRLIRKMAFPYQLYLKPIRRCRRADPVLHAGPTY